MKSKRCSNCYFKDCCDVQNVCEDYYPIEEFTDEEMERQIEKNRYQYLKAWNTYIKDFSD